MGLWIIFFIPFRTASGLCLVWWQSGWLVGEVISETWKGSDLECCTYFWREHNTYFWRTWNFSSGFENFFSQKNAIHLDCNNELFFFLKCVGFFSKFLNLVTFVFTLVYFFVLGWCTYFCTYLRKNTT